MRLVYGAEKTSENFCVHMFRSSKAIEIRGYLGGGNLLSFFILEDKLYEGLRRSGW